MSRMKHLAVLAVAGSVALGACADSDPLDLNAGEAEFSIVMQPEAGGAASALLASSSDPSAARVGLEAVESIILPIGLVEAQSADSGWVAAGYVNADVDLLSLPADGIKLVDGALPQGSYKALRFWLTADPSITLSEDVMVGRTLYEAGTHPLRIPSSEQAGVRLTADFVVDESGQALTILYDGDATLQRVTATGSGTLKIAPRLRVENEDGDDVGEFDDDEEENDDEGVEVEGLVTSVTESGFVFEDGMVVIIQDETELGGDLLSLAAVAETLVAGEVVRAEAEGALDTQAGVTTMVATEIEFEVDGDDDA